MIEIALLLAAIIKYGRLAMQGADLAIEAMPKIVEYIELAYSLATRDAPPTEEEKAKINAAVDEINALIDADIAAREGESKESGGL